MITKIPMPLISAISELVVANETHAQINSLFMHAEASGESPDANDPGINKLNKCLTWLQRTNREHPAPLNVAAAILEKYLDDPAYQGNQSVSLFGLPPTESPTSKAIKRIETILANNNLTYTQGGRITEGLSTPTQTLSELIRGRDLKSIEIEFERALENVTKDPSEAVLAACNILESLCQTYIEDEVPEQMPQKKDIKSVWGVVKEQLGLEPRNLEDNDLKAILGGLSAIVTGIGSLRTHASASHGKGRTRYNLEPRHARLAIHSAHTLVTFIIETWDKRKSTHSSLVR
ncbi:hypothetical protein D3C78_364920 [compost metagenome]